MVLHRAGTRKTTTRSNGSGACQFGWRKKEEGGGSKEKCAEEEEREKEKEDARKKRGASVDRASGLLACFSISIYFRSAVFVCLSH